LKDLGEALAEARGEIVEDKVGVSLGRCADVGDIVS
jgi:hypothetical protein